MAHVDFGPFPGVNVVKGRAELLSDPVSIMRCVKQGLHQTPSNSTQAYKICLENFGRRVKVKESCRQTLLSKSSVTADSVGARGSLFGEHRKGNHWLLQREREICTAQFSGGRRLRPQAARWGAEHCHHTCAQQAAPNCSVPWVSWINQTQNGPTMPLVHSSTAMAYTRGTLKPLLQS